jgi:ribosomal-protein-alanine N-acetyltransferase
MEAVTSNFSNTKIREMVEADLPRVIELEHKIFPDPWPDNSFRLEIRNRNVSRPCVLEKDSIICGYAILWQFAGELHIGNFAIDTDLQNKGFGSFFLEEILNKHKKLHTAFLEVRISNKAAIALYEKFGFKKLYERENYYRDGETAVVMERSFA